MAKGKKLTTSRSELFLGYTYDQIQSHETLTGESEYAEAEVWSMVNGDNDRSTYNSHGAWYPPRPTAEVHRSPTTRDRWPALEDGHVNGLPLAFEDSGKTVSPRIVHQTRGQTFMGSRRLRNMATSAPMNVPDWSKIYRVDSVESMHESDDGEDGDFDMVPPHEYVARSRNSAANSVYEGIGRTLKGRDMSRVRDAVWSKTGFNG